MGQGTMLQSSGRQAPSSEVRSHRSPSAHSVLQRSPGPGGTPQTFVPAPPSMQLSPAEHGPTSRSKHGSPAAKGALHRPVSSSQNAPFSQMEAPLHGPPMGWRASQRAGALLVSQPKGGAQLNGSAQRSPSPGSGAQRISRHPRAGPQTGPFRSKLHASPASGSGPHERSPVGETAQPPSAHSTPLPHGIPVAGSAVHTPLVESQYVAPSHESGAVHGAPSAKKGAHAEDTGASQYELGGHSPSGRHGVPAATQRPPSHASGSTQANPLDSHGAPSIRRGVQDPSSQLSSVAHRPGAHPSPWPLSARHVDPSQYSPSSHQVVNSQSPPAPGKGSHDPDAQ